MLSALAMLHTHLLANILQILLFVCVHCIADELNFLLHAISRNGRLTAHEAAGIF